MKNSSASERNRQDAALLIAKQLTEFWFGNFVTFKWWNELWIQEALGDFVKYFAVDRAYPEYSIVSYVNKKSLKIQELFNLHFSETTIHHRGIS